MRFGQEARVWGGDLEKPKFNGWGLVIFFSIPKSSRQSRKIELAKVSRLHHPLVKQIAKISSPLTKVLSSPEISGGEGVLLWAEGGSELGGRGETTTAVIEGVQQSGMWGSLSQQLGLSPSSYFLTSSPH